MIKTRRISNKPIQHIQIQEDIVSYLETIQLIQQHFQIEVIEEFLVHVQSHQYQYNALKNKSSFFTIDQFYIKPGACLKCFIATIVFELLKKKKR
jgi:hypothetical protein